MFDVNTIVIPVKIPAGLTGLQEGYVDLMVCQVFDSRMPASWVIVDITFQACEREGDTYYGLYDDSATHAEMSVPAAQKMVVTLENYSKHLVPLQYNKNARARPVHRSTKRGVPRRANRQTQIDRATYKHARAN